MIFVGFLHLLSCNISKYLTKDEIILKENKFVLKNHPDIDDPRALKSELYYVSKQRPISKTMHFREWVYFKTSKSTDTSQFKKWVRSSFSEKPSIYDDVLTNTSVSNMRIFMQEKGFLDAQVFYQVRTRNQEAIVTYTVDAGRRYSVESLEYVSKDTALVKLMEQYKPTSMLGPGNPIDIGSYQLETKRITAFLQNIGFAEFSIKDIGPIVTDSSKKMNYLSKGLAPKLPITIELYRPDELANHKRFTIGAVRCFTDYLPNQSWDTLTSLSYNHIDFYTREKKFSTKPERLAETIFLQPNDLSTRNALEKSYARLNRLGLYKYINIRQLRDSITDSILNYNIQLTPVPKLPVEYGGDLNLQTIEQTGSFLEISGRAGLRNKNTFSGGELFGVDLKLGLEFNFSNNTRVTAYQVQASTFIKAPKMYDFTGHVRAYNSIRVINRKYFDKLYSDGTTKATLTADFSNDSRLYNLVSVQGGYGHELVLSTARKQNIEWTGFKLFLTSNFSDNLERLVNTQKYLRYSLSDQLLTGLLFRKFQFQFRSNPNNAHETYSMLGSFSQSGLEYHGLKAILGSKYRSFINEYEDDDKKIHFAQFLKTEFEGSYTKQYTPQTAFIFRMNLGIGLPFGSSSELPFAEQFFLGGPLSMRGWRIRELGPGSYRDPEASAPYYQTSNFKFEMNGEYRFPIFWIFKGAIFADIGNIWLLKKDEQRPGGELSFKNLSSIAVNTGFGVRMDFTYFIFRVDAGSILKTAYKLEDENTHLLSYKYPYPDFKSFLRGLNFNFALGYPF